MVSKEIIEKVWEVYKVKDNPIMSKLKKQMIEVIKEYQDIEKMIKNLKHSVDNNLVDMRNVKGKVNEIYDKLQELNKKNES